MKKLIQKIKESFKRFIFNQFMKYSPSWIDNPIIIEFSRSVMQKYYGERFMPVREIPVKKGEIKYTLLVSGDGKRYNLGRHDTKEILEQVNINE